MLLDLLESVQTRVNGALTPRAEPPGQDLWQLGAASGDCEDYALAKQAALRAAGLPAGAVRLATARLPHGELHAVLTVETDRGTLVLDNLQRRVVPMNALDLCVAARPGHDRTLRWRELAALGRPAPRHPPRRLPERHARRWGHPRRPSVDAGVVVAVGRARSVVAPVAEVDGAVG